MRDADRRKLEDVADALMDSLLTFSRRLSKEVPRPGARQFDPSRFVLKKVWELGPVSMSEIGRHMEISKPYMTALVNKLIGEGLVERVSDPADRRIVKVRITGAGRSALRKFERGAREAIVRSLSSLDSSDISSLHESVIKIRNIVSSLDSDKIGGLR